MIPRALVRNVVVLGCVSLLADVASDMVVPLLPAFLAALGAGPAFLGLVEGSAEAVAAVFKYVSGGWADRSRRLLPLAALGYGIAAVARPLLALAQAPVHVLGLRALDRAGKGMRTSPRDKLLAGSVAPARLAEAFAFHRGMDHAGAALGPLLASALLIAWPGELRRTFLVASIFGFLAVLALGLVREHAATHPPPPSGALPGPPAPAPRGLLLAIAIFTLGNSTDALLLLRAQQVGVATAHLPLLWAALHVVRSAASWPLGRWADRVGRTSALAAGWGWYALCYGGFAALRTPGQVWLVFAAYGLVAGLTEGTERALVAGSVPPSRRGRALGVYNLVSGFGLLVASVLAGLVWERVSPSAALGLGALCALLAAALLLAGRAASRA